MSEAIVNPEVRVPEPTIIGNATYLVEHFQRIENGWIAYKIFNSVYTAPEHWNIAAGSIISESRLNREAWNDCAPGINVAKNMEWIANFISVTSSDENGSTEALVWKVFIPDTSIIVIPDHTDGKIRTNQIQLLETVGTVYYDTDDDDDLFIEDDDDELDEPITQD